MLRHTTPHADKENPTAAPRDAKTPARPVASSPAPDVDVIADVTDASLTRSFPLQPQRQPTAQLLGSQTSTAAASSSAVTGTAPLLRRPAHHHHHHHGAGVASRSILRTPQRGTPSTPLKSLSSRRRLQRVSSASFAAASASTGLIVGSPNASPQPSTSGVRSLISSLVGSNPTLATRSNLRGLGLLHDTTLSNAPSHDIAHVTTTTNNNNNDDDDDDDVEYMSALNPTNQRPALAEVAEQQELHNIFETFAAAGKSTGITTRSINDMDAGSDSDIAHHPHNASNMAISDSDSVSDGMGPLEGLDIASALDF